MLLKVQLSNLSVLSLDSKWNGALSQLLHSLKVINITECSHNDYLKQSDVRVEWSPSCAMVSKEEAVNLVHWVKVNECNLVQCVAISESDWTETDNAAKS